MLIKNLNAVFRKRHRLIFGIFTVIVIISFVFMGYGGRGGDGGSGASGEVGVAFGKSVSRADLYEISRRLAVLGEAFQGGSRELPAEQLFGVYCMLAKAQQLGLSASDKEVAAMLRRLPFLQKDGKFDLGKYREMLDGLQRRGISEEEFTGAVRDQLVLEKLQRALADGIVVTDNEAAEFYRSGKLKFEVKVATFSGRSFVAKVKKPTDAELQKYFQSHRGDYEIPGSVTAIAARVPYAKFTAEADKLATPERLQKFFKDNGAAFADKAGKVPGFEKVKGEVRKKFVAAAARDLALRAAYKLTAGLFEPLTESPAAKRAGLFADAVRQAGFTVLPAATAKLDAKTFGKIDSPAFMQALGRTSLANCLTDAVADDTGILLGCVTGRVENRPAEFKEVASQVTSAYVIHTSRELALAAARKTASDLAAKPAAQRAANFAALPGVTFTDFTFSRLAGAVPPGFEAAAQAVTQLKAGEVTAALPSADGSEVRIALLVRRIPADPAGFAKEAEQCRMMCRFYKMQLAMTALGEELSANCRFTAPTAPEAEQR